MMKRWVGGLAVLGCALPMLLIVHGTIRAQGRTSQFEEPRTNILTLEGPAIHILVSEPLPRSDLRRLTTDSHTVRDHPDLAEYYRRKADRLQAEAERDQLIARDFGDLKPLNVRYHYNIGRNARHYHVIAKESFSHARVYSLLAALYAQAAQGEGCFSCHNLHGLGGKIAPDLATEGMRGRSDAWLIGHFKNPQAYSPTSVMPALGGLTNRELQALATFLRYQK